MNSSFTKRLVSMDSLEQVQRALRERRDEILTAIEEQRVKPSQALMSELADLNIAIGDVPEVDNG